MQLQRFIKACKLTLKHEKYFKTGKLTQYKRFHPNRNVERISAEVIGCPKRKSLPGFRLPGHE